MRELAVDNSMVTVDEAWLERNWHLAVKEVVLTKAGGLPVFQLIT